MVFSIFPRGSNQQASNPPQFLGKFVALCGSVARTRGVSSPQLPSGTLFDSFQGRVPLPSTSTNHQKDALVLPCNFHWAFESPFCAPNQSNSTEGCLIDWKGVLVVKSPNCHQATAPSL